MTGWAPSPERLPPPWAGLGRRRASLWVLACPVLFPLRVLIGSVDQGPRLLLVCMPFSALKWDSKGQLEPSSHLRVWVVWSQVLLLSPGAEFIGGRWVQGDWQS